MMPNPKKADRAEPQLVNEFQGKTILVTGGCGSIGEAIIQQLLEYGPRAIRVLDNNETGLFELDRQLAGRKPNPLRFLVGDVRDLERINLAMEGVDVVFHAAALKHVPLCEHNPFEAIKTNVLGTQNILNAARNQGVSKVLFISTDKAINPTNVMGATKLLGERLTASSSQYFGARKILCASVRFGNVLYSRGSVLEIWKDQLRKGQPITITDGQMTRFFMSRPQSVGLIFSAAVHAGEGETFILKMPSIRIQDLAAAFLELNGKPATHVRYVGRRPGEKIHETLFELSEALTLENDKFFVQMPVFSREERIRQLKKEGFRETTRTHFSSSDPGHIIPVEDIKKVLSQEPSALR